MTLGDAGLADDYWHSYYTPDEVAEIEQVSTTSMFVSEDLPIHVRMYVRGASSPTVVMAHPMLPYGILLARLQLPFFRAGYNVVQWDLPGWGQSGGRRAGEPVPKFMAAWENALAFTQERFTGPVFAMGLAEDSVTCYYVAANHPAIRAISLHTLHEYGDPDGVRWQGSNPVLRLKWLGSTVGAKVRPDLGVSAHSGLPFNAIFSGPDDGPLLKLFEQDPLRVQQFSFPLAASMMTAKAPPVRFEDCRTPVQVIASAKSQLWPYEMNRRYFDRVGGPKELVRLEGVDQWVYTREFHELYASHVIRWFDANGAHAPSSNGATPDRDTAAALRDGGLGHPHWRRYYTPAEVEEVVENTQTTMLISGGCPVHVRVWEQERPREAMTVVIGSSILSYGLHLVRIQAPFFRAGFNVVQFDFPGLGQSGGPRGGGTVGEFICVWRDALAFAQLRYGDSLCVMGVGEDGVTGYYAGANQPHVRAISVHNLFEYGEPDAVQGQGPYWMVRAKAAGLAAAVAAAPAATMPGTDAVHWDWVFGATDDQEQIELLQADPLSLSKVELRMLRSILERRRPAVAFEDCRTPVQVIVSERNKVCPEQLVLRNYARLGGEKEVVRLAGKPQWELNREFQEAYCAPVMRWFSAHGEPGLAPVGDAASKAPAQAPAKATGERGQPPPQESSVIR